jgi:hypothetical protein
MHLYMLSMQISLSLTAALYTVYILVGLYRFDCRAAATSATTINSNSNSISGSGSNDVSHSSMNGGTNGVSAASNVAYGVGDPMAQFTAFWRTR